jgi:RND family efflux transporter MFP subunit
MLPLVRGLIGLLTCVLSTLAHATEPVEVGIVQPEPVALRDTLELSGSVTARHEAQLSARVDGLVSELLVEAGDRVRAQQILLRQDTELSRRELALAAAQEAQAQAGLDEARRLVEEAQRLRDDNFIPATELASREAAVASARAAQRAALAQRRLAEERLARHELPAPFDGVVAERMTERGEWINRGDPVLRLVATEAVWLDVAVPQEYRERITRDTPVSIRPDSAREVSLRAEVERVLPVGDAQTRTFLLRLVPSEPSPALFPGSSASARLSLSGDASGDAQRLPADALLLHPDGGRSVFVIDDEDRASRRRVQVLEETANEVIVGHALAPDARVVLRGNRLLEDGTPVRVTSPAGTR